MAGKIPTTLISDKAAGLRVYHNHVRPHLELESHITPGEAAKITIEGNNKILTMIQAVAKSYDKSYDKSAD